MRRWLVLALALAAPAAARDPLGMFDDWGAFRDPSPLRCYAIAQPVDPGKGAWKPFAAIGYWPDQGARGQVHIRLSRARRADAAVILSVDAARWRMTAGAADAWAASPQEDAALRAKMRAARSMSISSIDKSGRPFADIYRLQGAATAMDAAALGCVRR
ncbi:MAG: hypothetical protein ACKOXK_11020 [Chakrabartia sp.]